MPVLGDALRLSAKSPISSIAQLGADIGPIFEVKIFGTRMLVASGPVVVAELCDESRFTKYVGPELKQLRMVIGTGLVAADTDDPMWHHASDLMQPAFSQAAMRAYHRTLTGVAGEFAQYWDGKVGQTVDVLADLTRAVQEMTARVTFGHVLGSFAGDVQPRFMAELAAMINHVVRMQIMQNIPLGPRLMKRAQRTSDERGQYINGVVDDVIRTRRANPDRRFDDILDAMLRANDGRISDEDVRYQIIGLTFGADATIVVPTVALYYLSQNPAAREAARAEVDAVWGDGSPTFEQVSKLRYLRRVLDESMRLRPPEPGFARMAKCDVTLHGGYELKQGDWAMVFNPLLHRSSVWGTNVDEFDPDRFLSDRVKARPAHTFKPFGTGMRSCIGRHLAILQSLLIVGTILQRYEFDAEPGYRLRMREVGGVKPEGFMLRIRRRTAMS